MDSSDLDLEASGALRDMMTCDLGKQNSFVEKAIKSPDAEPTP